MTRMIRGFAETMTHVRKGLDVVGDDLAEMYRRVNHPEGRKGYRRQGLKSELGIPGYPKETIEINLGSSIEGDTIKVLHHLGLSLLSCTYDGQVILRVRIPDYVELPETVRTGHKGQPLSRIVDLSTTSVSSLGEAKVTDVFINGDGTQSIYMKAPVTEYAIEALLEMQPKG